MSEFEPAISIPGQGFVFYLISFVSFIFVVSFFLYENKKKRNIFVEFVLAIFSALTLGIAIFFALIRADVVL